MFPLLDGHRTGKKRATTEDHHEPPTDFALCGRAFPKLRFYVIRFPFLVRGTSGLSQPHSHPRSASTPRVAIHSIHVLLPSHSNFENPCPSFSAPPPHPAHHPRRPIHAEHHVGRRLLAPAPQQLPPPPSPLAASRRASARSYAAGAGGKYRPRNPSTSRRHLLGSHTLPRAFVRARCGKGRARGNLVA